MNRRRCLALIAGTTVSVAGCLQGGDGAAPGASAAVVDRIEGDQAVVLLEDAGEQRTVPVGELPSEAREPGAVLSLPANGSIPHATYDAEETAERRQDNQDRFDRLAENASRSS